MNDPKIAPVLDGPRDEHRDAVVKGLEDFLEAAREGRFDGGVIVLQRTDTPGVDYAILGTRSALELVGHLELIKLRVLMEDGP